MRAQFMAQWDPEHALQVIDRERITFMIGPPTFFVDLMRAPGFSRERVRSLRLISSGGAGVTSAFVDEAAATFDCTVKRTYGSTEAPTVTTSHAGDPVARARATDGRATGEVELRIDRETGELLLRGPELFVGYTDVAQTRAAHARGGWFRTGDLGRIDDGWLTIVGRLKDVIIRGGENISAAEVESVLEAHPAVRQAVAVGRPDHRLGERVVAFVVTSRPFDLAQCRDWFAARGVTRFKWPEHVVALDALPAMAAGKPDRNALRAQAKDLVDPIA
jgi:acyl-CoA synthetase (AMP-forming)/AMP-acid ligase II